MKKRRVFQEGLIYVFTMKKFKKDSCNTKRDCNPYRKYNGMQVVELELEIKNKRWGKLKNGTMVHVDWCKCIGKEQTNEIYL